MTTIFASIVSGGAIGVADQYLCLLLLSLATRFNLIQLPSEISFMSSDWFTIAIGVVWIATVLPAYGSLIDPVLLRFVNTTIGLFGGILVPASGALLSIATANFVGTSETAHSAVQTIAYHASSVPNSDLLLIGGGGAFFASLFTFIKFLIKPMLATATGMAATTATAATYKTIENVIALVVMTTLYFLASISPWLLILLMAIITLILLTILVFALYQLWKLGQGIGKVIRLFESNPKAGLAVILEPFIWGSGWVLIKGWQSGVNKLALWAVSLFIIWFVLPIVFFIIPPIAALIPFIATFAAIYFIGIKSSKKLLETIEKEDKSISTTPVIVQTRPDRLAKRIPTDRQDWITCSNCGTKLNSSSVECLNCGSRFSQAPRHTKLNESN